MEPLTIGAVTLRPCHGEQSLRALSQSIERDAHTATPFLLTSEAIVEVRDPSETDRGWERAWELLWPVHEALRFLQHRDFCVSDWSLHATPDCTGEALSRGALCAQWVVPYAPAVDVNPNERAAAIADATALWADDDRDRRSAISYAAATQHMALVPGLPQEGAFIGQWTALEMLANHYCESDEGPQELRGVRLQNGAFRKLRREFGGCVDLLVASGALNGPEACALKRFAITTRIGPPAAERIAALLTHCGVRDVPQEWLDVGCWLRNITAHGLYWADELTGRTGGTDPGQEMHWMLLAGRELVDRCIMWAIGYEPKRGGFGHGCVAYSRYTRRGDAK